MTFDIPLRDTSSAGLGITLKGKTSIIGGKSTDLGIFIKTILTGGAAYQVYFRKSSKFLLKLFYLFRIKDFIQTIKSLLLMIHHL